MLVAWAEIGRRSLCIPWKHGSFLEGHSRPFAWCLLSKTRRVLLLHAPHTQALSLTCIRNGQLTRSIEEPEVLPNAEFQQCDEFYGRPTRTHILVILTRYSVPSFELRPRHEDKKENVKFSDQDGTLTNKISDSK